MQLTASSTAQFFIQNEYHHVEIEGSQLKISSIGSEERIPFTVWNGKVTVQRGLFWGSLSFSAHEELGKQQVWVVQGLPWPDCRDFAQQSVQHYQDWHNEQCRQLNHYLPEWEQELFRLKNLPSYLPHSAIMSWVNKMEGELEQMDMTLFEAQQRMPERMDVLTPWYVEPSQQLSQRNHIWIERERHNWEVLFNQLESSPLNVSQQQAVLLNDDNNLVLAGAGSGKTSVLTARVAYLLQSHLAQAEQILMLAFGRDAAKEMQQRLGEKVGMAADNVTVNTFHQLGLKIISQVEGQSVTLSPLALEEKARHAWCVNWLKSHWATDTNFRRWQKHLTKWPIAYLTGDEELAHHVENPKLIAWLDKQLMQFAAMYISKKDIQERLVDHEEYTRFNSELALSWPCFTAWKKMLKEERQIDFPTMISRATQYVTKGKFVSPWRYIMVDEYQDISPDRLALIEALAAETKKQAAASLFAVGDDWQSIYQFAGSEVNLTTGFSDRFAHSTVHHLDTTYRFNNQIGSVANAFVQANPSQLEKELNSFKQKKSKCVHTIANNQIEKVLDDLNRKATSRKSVLILGRNHYHKPPLLSDWQKLFLSLNIQFMTCHASKGKEADFVIVVSVDEGQFPAKKKQLHVDTALTESEDDFPHAEERRLFYVAMTRAKEQVWIAHTGQGSSFVQELHQGDYPQVTSRC